MKNLFIKLVAGSLFSLCAAHASATLVSISSYDITQARTSGFGGWAHTYSGTITPTGATSTYTGGSGTLNDGVLETGVGVYNTQLFSRSDASTITLHLAESALISSLSLYSFNGANGIPGNITGFDVTINGVSQYFSTTGFGSPSNNGHDYPNELIDLAGSGLAGLVTDTITLSNFTTEDPFSQYFSISEIHVDGGATSVPEPGSLALLGLGLAGLFTKRRRIS